MLRSFALDNWDSATKEREKGPIQWQLTEQKDKEMARKTSINGTPGKGTLVYLCR